MNVLSIDSSSKVATIALINDEEIISEYILNNKREHSTILMPMIDKILNENNMSINDIDGYVVSKGPGSFTGLRIGMATIKGLSFGSNRPYVSLSSLDGLAYSVSSFSGIICPIMTALRENVYTSLYKLIDGKLHNILEPVAMDIDELVEILKEKNENIIFTGDGILKHRDYLAQNIKNAVFAPKHLINVRASSIGELGLMLIKDGKSDNPNSAPLYIKKPQAEQDLERRLNKK